MCFEKGRACFFLKFWEIKTCFTKKGERLTSNKGMVTYRYSYWEAVQSKNFPLVKHRKEKSAKKHSRLLCSSCLGELTHRAAFTIQFAAHGGGHALSGQYLYFCLRYLSESELAVFTKVLLNGPGVIGPLEISHI